MQSADSARSLRLSAILCWGCKQPETSRNFREGGCAEPETVGNVHPGAAQSLRRPPVFVKGGCTEPEAVGNFHHGAVQSLRRPPILRGWGAQRTCSCLQFSSYGRKEPETPRNFGDWRAQKVPRALDCLRFYDGGASSLRRPTICVNWGSQRLRVSASFIMGLQPA